MIRQQLLFVIKYSNKKDIGLTVAVNLDDFEKYLSWRSETVACCTKVI